MEQDVSSKDFDTAGMTAWNSLTILLDKEDKLFDDLKEFKTFYYMIMEKLMNEQETDA